MDRRQASTVSVRFWGQPSHFSQVLCKPAATDETRDVGCDNAGGFQQWFVKIVVAPLILQWVALQSSTIRPEGLCQEGGQLQDAQVTLFEPVDLHLNAGSTGCDLGRLETAWLP